jgi:hypothetical protein
MYPMSKLLCLRLAGMPTKYKRKDMYNNCTEIRYSVGIPALQSHSRVDDAHDVLLKGGKSLSAGISFGFNELMSSWPCYCFYLHIPFD